MEFKNPSELKRFLEYVLDEPRRTIVKAIVMRPGITTDSLYSIVKSRFRIGRNALYYHLRILEENNIVYSDRSKPRRWFVKTKRVCLSIVDENTD